MTAYPAVSPGRRQWLVPAGLIGLSVVPVLAGSLRIGELASGGPVTEENARFFDAPAPVVVHIVAATAYALGGAFQFVPVIRRRHPTWHRAAGRLLVAMGLAVAFSGIWMTLFSARAPDTGDLLQAIRLVVGTAMATFLVLGVVAIRRRAIQRHRAWMVRAYALGLGAGTQVFTHLPWLALAGSMGTFTKAMLMLAGWLVNVAVAEWALRRRR